VISPVNAAALVGAGVASVLVFPTVALGLLREPGTPSGTAGRPDLAPRDVPAPEVLP